MKVGILAFPEAISSSVTGPYDILTKANLCFKQFYPRYEGDKFEVQLVGHPLNSISNHALLPISIVIEEEHNFDLLVVPAPSPEHIPSVLEQGKPMFDFIKQQYEKGTEIASICMGAFLLASSGIIDGKRVTTHWMGAQNLRELFPKVKVEDDKVIIDEAGIYSCGGAFTFTTLMMYLVEKFCGHETAVFVSKIMLIDLYKDPQTSYRIFQLQKQHQDVEIIKAQNLLEQKFSNGFSLNDLADKVSMTRRTLIRRFKKATGNTPLEYLQRVRVEAAKKTLENTHEPIEAIPSKVGYEDYGSFLNVFKKHTGISPSAYRKKYCKISEVVAG